MPGLDRSIVEHRLPPKKGFWPFQQRARQMRTEVLEESRKRKRRGSRQGKSGRAGVPSGFLALYLYRRRMAGGESMWISGTSTGPTEG
jgi:hypothetical protein